MRSTRAFAAERSIGRLLIGMAYVAAGLLTIGLALMFVNGISPLDQGPPLDPATLASQIAALDPAGFVWLGLLTIVAAPIGRIILAAIAFARDGDRLMVAISIGILVVLGSGVAVALLGSG
jgi:uncharacterized membrane protein